MSEPTPRERLEARGYQLDEKGRTIHLGYGPKVEGNFTQDTRAWLDEHTADLELRCQSTRRVVGHAWRVPGEDVWYVSGKHPREYRGPLSKWTTTGGNLPVMCPEHGMALVPAAWVADETASKRPQAAVLCADPAPEYAYRT